MHLRAGDLLYIPSEVYVYRFDDTEGEKIAETMSDTWPLVKPTNALLLQDEDKGSIWLKILYNGENLYVDKHDGGNYQEL